MTNYARRQAQVSPPSDLLLDEFEARGWLSGMSVDLLGLPQPLVWNILTGAIPINQEIADRLAEILGTSADFWLTRQHRWDAWWPEEVSRRLAAAKKERERG